MDTQPPIWASSEEAVSTVITNIIIPDTAIMFFLTNPVGLEMTKCRNQVINPANNIAVV